MSENKLARGSLPDGRRRINLQRRERQQLSRNLLVERAVALFLDLENDRTWQEIADELGIALPTLKKLTKEKEFEDAYNAHFVELGHDPRLMASRQAVSDLVPLAVRELRSLLADQFTPPTVRLNAIKEILHYAGFDDTKTKGDDKREVADFLKGAGVVNITQNNLMPAEYADMMRQIESDIIDGQTEEV
jgi:hypothetical protein